MRILAISDYDGLRSSREMVLISAGYSVLSVRSEAVNSSFDPSIFDIAVICQSVQTTRAAQAAYLLRIGNPEIQILRILPEDHGSETGYDALIDGLSSPQHLLESIRLLRLRGART